MARRKKYVDDGYSSDSVSSSSSQADDWQRKRKRKGTKEDAIYGIFGSGSEGENGREGGAGRTMRARDQKGKRVDYRKGQSFVPATASVSQAEGEGDGQDSGSASGHSDKSSSSDDDGDEDDELHKAELNAREPGTEMEEMETRNPFALGPTREAAAAIEQHDGPGGFRPSSFVSSRGGIGARSSDTGGDQLRSGIEATAGATAGATARAGIGSSGQAKKEAPTFARGSEMPGGRGQHAPMESSNLDEAGVPSSFGSVAPSSAFTQRKSQEQRVKQPASYLTPPSTSIKFGSGLGGKFDPSKYLAQMGWTGGGLGKAGEGIVNPIEVKQRPERAGIAFGGIKEKTKQTKDEARRRGEDVSTDEEEREKRKRSDKQRQRVKTKEDRGAQAWTRTEKKPRKPKVEHRTYEQILAEHGQAGATQAGVGQILDAAGNEFSSLSAALAKHSVPSNESTQLVEIRHNLRLICDGNQAALQLLAKEGAGIQEKCKWLARDRDESQRRRGREEGEAKRMRGVLDLVYGIERLGRQSQTDPNVDLASFDGLVERIIAEYGDAVSELHLDEAIVGAVVPILRKQWSQWEPLEQPGLTTGHLGRWKKALRVDAQSDIMTPYESMLWNVWMPPIRSAFNNQWDVYKPASAIALFQAWTPLLSSFLVDNLTQQLILPKLSKAVADWDAKVPLHTVVFPWMALLGDQMDEVVAEAKRRLRSSLKTWKPTSGVPVGLKEWREAKVFSSSEWNSMLLDHVVPKLSSYLDSHLVIDPKAQDLRPLELFLSWKSLMASKIISKVMLAKFVPKWLQTLHSWLVDRNANLEEVAQWYESWKDWFVKQGLLSSVPSLQQGFQVALQLMSKAMELGGNRSQLPLPNLKAIQAASVNAADAPSNASVPASFERAGARKERGHDDEKLAALSFRKVVEDALMEADLIMQSLNQREVSSGKPLFRVSKHLDGRRGVTIFLEDDVIFAETRDEDGQTRFEPVSIEDVVKQAV